MRRNSRDFAIAAISALILASNSSSAQAGWQSIRYVVGGWPTRNTVEISIDAGGMAVRRLLENGVSNQSANESHQLTRTEAEALNAKVLAVWQAGSSRPMCPPSGHTHMQLTIVSGGETRADEFMTPPCATSEGKMLGEFLIGLFD